MSNWAFGIVGILVVLGVLFLARGALAQGRPSASAYRIAEVYEGFRSRALATKPNGIGLKLQEGTAEPYGVLMETGYPQAIATLATFSTGDTSLYFSNGGGVLGGIGHESVRRATVEFISLSEKFVPQLVQATTFPTPNRGMVRFYVLTPRGIFTAEAVEESLGNDREALSPLFHKGHEVIARFREAEQRKGRP